MNVLENEGNDLRCTCGELMTEKIDGYPIAGEWFEDVPQFACSTCELVYVRQSVIHACRQQLFLEGLTGSAHND